MNHRLRLKSDKLQFVEVSVSRFFRETRDKLKFVGRCFA